MVSSAVSNVNLKPGGRNGSVQSTRRRLIQAVGGQVSWLLGATDGNNGDTVHVWRLDSGLRTIQRSVFIQGILVHNDDRLFNFRVKTSHHADLLASNIVPLMAQQSMVYRFKLRDCGLKKGQLR